MAGRFQMFFGAQGGDPTGWIALRILYGKSPPTTNLSRFSFPEYDRAAEQFMARGDGVRASGGRPDNVRDREQLRTHHSTPDAPGQLVRAALDFGIQSARHPDPLEIHGHRCTPASVETTRQLTLATTNTKPRDEFAGLDRFRPLGATSAPALRPGIILRLHLEGGGCPSASGAPARRGAHNSETPVQQPDQQFLVRESVPRRVAETLQVDAFRRGLSRRVPRVVGRWWLVT